MTYSDFFTSFLPHPDTKQLLVKTDERAISQSIRNLIMTNRGERPFENNIGSNIRAFLYEQFDDQTEQTIKDYIKQTLVHEPRAKISNIAVRADKQIGALFIAIEYFYGSITTPVVVQLTLSRVR